MSPLENGKRRKLFYDFAAALDDLEFSRAFGPGILAAFFYGIVSGSMSFVNKVVLTSYSYHFPNVIMLAQVSVMAIVLESARILGYTSMLEYTLERGKQFLVPSICFALHTTLALRALDDLSIPMYNVLRRLLPLTSLLFACLMLKKKPSILVITSVVLVVAGCIIAGIGDLEFSASAYIFALLSVVCQSFYLTYIQKTGVEKGLSTLTVLHTNCINCIPLLLIYTVCSKELLSAFRFGGYIDPSFQIALMIDVGFGCILNYSLFLCTTMNSALTTSLVGVVKGVLTTIIGFFTFGGVPVTVLVILGISLNTFGGAAYSYAKYAEKMTTEIEKHVHKHTIRVLPDKLLKEHLEKQKNGLVSSSCDQDHVTKNGVKTLEHDGISESHVVVEVDDGQDLEDLNSNSESSID